ncbi:Thioredoxin-like protein 1 [Mitosporidium daphniae]
MAGSVIEISTLDQFQEILKKDKYVVVDFYADWCGPCKQLSPKLVALAETETQVTFVKVDVDKSNISSLATEYKVSGIPAIFFIKDGKVVSSVVA